MRRSFEAWYAVVTMRIERALHRATARTGAFTFAVLGASVARADPLPLRVTYTAPSECPGADAFIAEISARTRLARIAEGEAPALSVSAELTRRGAIVRGRLLLDDGSSRVARGVEGEGCEEVVAALALVTALSIDPHASLSAKPARVPQEPPPPPPYEPPKPGPPPPPPPRLETGSTPPIERTPRAPIDTRWLLGARFVTDLAASPRALLGGGAFAERPFDAWWRPSLRLALDGGATGSVSEGPGAAEFWRVTGRIQGCAFEARIGTRLVIAPCVELDLGALHAEGTPGGSLTFVRDTTIFWAAAGFVPRVDLRLGPVVVDLQVGPVLPMIRHDFVFEPPSYAVYSVPAVTWTLGVGVGGHFP